MKLRFQFCAVLAAIMMASLFAVTSFGQADSTIQQLTAYKTLGGAHFEYRKDTAVYMVSIKQVLMIMKDDPMAYAEFKKAKANSSIAGIIGFTGGVMIGFPVGTAIAGGEPEWGLAAGGAALILTSLHFTANFRKHAQTAVEIFNKNHSAFRPRVDCYYGGLSMKVIIRF